MWCGTTKEKMMARQFSGRDSKIKAEAGERGEEEGRVCEEDLELEVLWALAMRRLANKQHLN
jgi:hypothetical protein